MRRNNEITGGADVTKEVSVNPHTWEETIAFAKEKFGFEEVTHDNPLYNNAYVQFRNGLILQKRPELLGEEGGMPEFENDPAKAEGYRAKVTKLWEMADLVPKDVFDIDFTYLRRCEGNKSMDIFMERDSGMITGAAPGDKAWMKSFTEFLKEIIVYYGVSEEDIATGSERYQRFVNIQLL